ncbi:hypothetical protein [uncultured Arcticibacterium sp.]|uniref:hypothetical protein n=1 Tax=uncultured Arcticibacterium sp. TaxID=2173042 RepID=UPI0030F8783D
MKQLLFFLFFISSFHVLAIDVIFGCPNGNWTDAGCWSTGNLPSSTDRAVIGSPNSVEVNSSVSVGSIIASGNITVTASGVLDVNGGLSLINQNLGFLDISGTVNLEGGGVTLQNQNRLIVRTGALLNILNAASDAVNSEGEIKVNIGGEIIVSNAGDYGITNSGGFVNKGKVSIDGAVTGFLQTGFVDSLVNYQILNIKNCTEYGLESDGGLVENYDRLRVENTTLAGLYGHGANNELSEINNHEDAIMLVYSGIDNSNDLINDGYIYSSGTNITSFVTGDLVNNDTIIVSTKNSVGLSLMGDFTNNTGAVVISDSVSDNADFFFVTGIGRVDNYGLFQFDLKGQMHGLSHSNASGMPEYFSNHATIDIKNAKKGLELTYFKNLSTGIITVDSCTDTGLTVPGDSTINEGQITLKNGQSGYGLTTLTFGKFFNEGTLTIENHMGGDGIYNYSNLLFNDQSGIIDLTYSGTGTAFNNARGQFVNRGKVNMTLQGTSDLGLYIGSNVAQEFNNYGLFNLINESTVSVPNGIFVNGIMTIDTCSTFHTELPFQVQTIGTVNNIGLLSLSDSARISNDGTFNNYGLIEGLNGFHSDELTLNQGLISSPIYNSLTVGKKYTSGLLGAPVFSIPNNFYGDAAETQLAGILAGDYQSFEVNGFSTSDTLRFTVNLYGKCDLQMRLPVVTSGDYSCWNISEISFTGSPDESWFDVNNWSLMRLPNACDKVIIPSSERVHLLSNEYGRAAYLDIQTGAFFDTDSDAVLDVSSY